MSLTMLPARNSSAPVMIPRDLTGIAAAIWLHKQFGYRPPQTHQRLSTTASSMPPASIDDHTLRSTTPMKRKWRPASFTEIVAPSMDDTGVSASPSPSSDASASRMTTLQAPPGGDNKYHSTSESPDHDGVDTSTHKRPRHNHHDHETDNVSHEHKHDVASSGHDHRNANETETHNNDHHNVTNNTDDNDDDVVIVSTKLATVPSHHHSIPSEPGSLSLPPIARPAAFVAVTALSPSSSISESPASPSVLTTTSEPIDSSNQPGRFMLNRQRGRTRARRFIPATHVNEPTHVFGDFTPRSVSSTPTLLTPSEEAEGDIAAATKAAAVAKAANEAIKLLHGALGTLPDCPCGVTPSHSLFSHSEKDHPLSTFRSIGQHQRTMVALNNELMHIERIATMLSERRDALDAIVDLISNGYTNDTMMMCQQTILSGRVAVTATPSDYHNVVDNDSDDDHTRQQRQPHQRQLASQSQLSSSQPQPEPEPELHQQKQQQPLQQQQTVRKCTGKSLYDPSNGSASYTSKDHVCPNQLTNSVIDATDGSNILGSTQRTLVKCTSTPTNNDDSVICTNKVNGSEENIVALIQSVVHS
jgi:hypothetical protein